MNKTTKGVLMNVSTLVALAFFYFDGTPLPVLLVSGVFCLGIINGVLMFTKRRS